MLYAEVQDVEAGFRALSRDEQTQCAALLAEAAVIIDSYNPDAGKDAKRVVSCRMVRRQLGESDSGAVYPFPWAPRRAPPRRWVTARAGR